MKKIVLSILWVSVLVLIFCFSAQTGDVSKALTKNGIEKVVSSTIEKVTPVKESWQEKLMKPVRKMAHFLEFLVLGILTFLLLHAFHVPVSKSFCIALLFCVFYAVTDEVHQIFVEGRCARVWDVLLDGTGSFVGIVITYFLVKKKGDLHECN